MGGESGKGVGGDFRQGRRDRSQQHGFSHIWSTDKAHIGQELEFHIQKAFFSPHTFFGDSRRLSKGADKTGISPAAVTPASRNEGLPGTYQINQLLSGIRVFDHRSYRDRHDEIIATFPLLSFSSSMGAIWCFVPLLVTKIQECRQSVLGDQYYISPATAISTVGSSPWHKFFAAKADAAIPSVACSNNDSHLIDELHGVLRP